MEVQQYMNRDVKTCTEDDSVALATKRMAEYDIGSVIVVRDRKPIGIFTERDLVKRVVALGKDPTKVCIGEVMTRELITVEAEVSIGAAYHIFVERKVRHIPVVKNMCLLGIISQKDLVKVMDEQFFMTYFGKYGKRDLSGEY